jgi:hypothetical protein
MLNYVTGEQVLERLKFRGTVRSNLFGLGMVLIGFTFCAYVALFFSAIKYMKAEESEIGRHPSYPRRRCT